MFAALPILMLSLALPSAQGQNVQPAKPQSPQGAQSPRAKKEEKPFSKPFRFRVVKEDPDLASRKEFLEIMANLNHMQGVWKGAPDRGYDETGRPHTKQAGFERLRDKVTKQLARQGGMLKWILLNDRSPSRRRACFFGSLFVPEVQDGVHLLRYIPHEPQTTLRADAIAFSRAFLEKQLAEPKTDRQGRSRGYRYLFDVVPWVDLTRAPTATDRVRAFEVLTSVVRARPTVGSSIAAMMQRWIADNLTAKQPAVRKATRAWVEAFEPEAKMPGDDRGALALWSRILRKHFPDVRLRGGLCELYPGPDLDKIAEVGERLLRLDKLGKTKHVSIKTRLGTQHRVGVRLAAIPEPLDKLGMKEGDIVTAVNGTPITSCGDLLRVIERHLAKGNRTLLVEWIGKDESTRARSYILRDRQ